MKLYRSHQLAVAKIISGIGGIIPQYTIYGMIHMMY